LQGDPEEEAAWSGSARGRVRRKEEEEEEEFIKDLDDEEVMKREFNRRPAEEGTHVYVPTGLKRAHTCAFLQV